MKHIITEKSFYQFLKCPTWVYFNAHADETRLHEPLMNQLQDNGLIDAQRREIISFRPDIVEVTAEDPDEAFAETLAFMRDGRETIYGGILIDRHWVGRPDVLEKVEGKSKLGDYYYVAADIKRAHEMRDDYKFQACFYAELLKKIQGIRPVQGYVIAPNKTVFPFIIEEFEAEFKLNLEEIEAIVAGKKPVHFLTSGCKQSPWFKECRGITESCRDLSILNRIWKSEVSSLEKAGIKTVDQLAETSLQHLQNIVLDLNPARLERMHDQAISLRDGSYKILNEINFPESDIELFFDIESDPLRDFDYLFGVLVVTPEGEKYHAFVAKTPEEEADAWHGFAAFIQSHIDAPIYHYGDFERVVCNRFGAKYGISPIVKEALSRNMIDLLDYIRPNVILPLSFFSLKDIAQYIGFSWRAKDASGANSVLWFEDWLDNGNEKALQKVIDYNEDDVIATWKVKNWLRGKSL